MARGTADWGRVASGLQSVTELLSYVVGNSQAATLNAASTHLALFNPAASGKLARVQLILGFLSPAGAAGNTELELSVNRISNLGAGAARTPRPLDTGDAPASCTAAELHGVEPVLVLELFRVRSFVTFDGAPTLGRVGHPGNGFDVYRHLPGQSTKQLLLRPGEGLSVKNEIAASIAKAYFLLLFTEEPAG